MYRIKQLSTLTLQILTANKKVTQAHCVQATFSALEAITVLSR